MYWLKTELSLPPGGMKILCFKNGDCWTAYRFNYKDKSFWISALPSCILNPERQYKMGRCDEPDYWLEIPFDQIPGKYSGRMMVQPKEDGVLYTIDEFEKTFPKEYAHFIEDFIFALNNPKKKKKK